MTVAKVSEITSTSSKSFADAIDKGIKRANKTLKNLSSAWIADQEVEIENGKISTYRVRMRVTFVLEGGGVGRLPVLLAMTALAFAAGAAGPASIDPKALNDRIAWAD